MSYATWRFLEIYARWRESFLRLYPKKRLIPEPTDDSKAPFITVGEKGKKIGGLVALVIILALASTRNSK